MNKTKKKKNQQCTSRASPLYPWCRSTRSPSPCAFPCSPCRRCPHRHCACPAHGCVPRRCACSSRGCSILLILILLTAMFLIIVLVLLVIILVLLVLILLAVVFFVVVLVLVVLVLLVVVHCVCCHDRCGHVCRWVVRKAGIAHCICHNVKSCDRLLHVMYL
jgi:hypothetical protein